MSCLHAWALRSMAITAGSSPSLPFPLAAGWEMWPVCQWRWWSIQPMRTSRTRTRSVLGCWRWLDLSSRRSARTTSSVSGDQDMGWIRLSSSLSLSPDCRTGEAKITGAYKLPARCLLFIYKLITAADNLSKNATVYS